MRKERKRLARKAQEEKDAAKDKADREERLRKKKEEDD